MQTSIMQKWKLWCQYTSMEIDRPWGIGMCLSPSGVWALQWSRDIWRFTGNIFIFVLSTCINYCYSLCFRMTSFGVRLFWFVLETCIECSGRYKKKCSSGSFKKYSTCTFIWSLTIQMTCMHSVFPNSQPIQCFSSLKMWFLYIWTAVLSRDTRHVA